MSMDQSHNPRRRAALQGGMRAGLALAAASMGLLALKALAAPEEQLIKLSVKRFEFSQKTIRLKKGVPVVVEITSEDVPHGFSIPEFRARADVVMPGKTSLVRFTPDKAGEFQFLCDIFCGTKHEEVEGTLIVT